MTCATPLPNGPVGLIVRLVIEPSGSVEPLSKSVATRTAWQLALALVVTLLQLATGGRFGVVIQTFVAVQVDESPPKVAMARMVSVPMPPLPVYMNVAWPAPSVVAEADALVFGPSV